MKTASAFWDQIVRGYANLWGDNPNFQVVGGSPSVCTHAEKPWMLSFKSEANLTLKMSSAIWLFNNQLWAIIKWTDSLIQF